MFHSNIFGIDTRRCGDNVIERCGRADSFHSFDENIFYLIYGSVAYTAVRRVYKKIQIREIMVDQDKSNERFASAIKILDVALEVRICPRCPTVSSEFLDFNDKRKFRLPFSFVPSLAGRIFQFSLSVLCRHKKRCRCIQCVMYDAHNPLNEQSHFPPRFICFYFLFLEMTGFVCLHRMRQCDKKDIRRNTYIYGVCSVRNEFKVLNACCRECSLTTFLIAEVKA